jgi:hypothetical protein
MREGERGEEERGEEERREEGMRRGVEGQMVCGGGEGGFAGKVKHLLSMFMVVL